MSVIGGAERITHRLTKGIVDLIEVLGIETAIQNAAPLMFDPLRSNSDLLTALATGQDVATSGPVKLTLDPSGGFITLKSP